jgi:hypothetical protein
MGSYCEIQFDELSVCSAKGTVPDEWAALFQENDRRSGCYTGADTEADDSAPQLIGYCTDRSTFLWRLALLGANDAAMLSAFDHWLESARKTWQQYSELWDDDAQTDAARVSKALDSLDFNGWKQQVNKAICTRYSSHPTRPKDPFEQHFHASFDEDFLHFAGYGSLIGLRALLEAFPEAKEVSLDVGELVSAGYFEEAERICEQARSRLPFLTNPLEPTIILGEGSTDVLVLKKALTAMYPELVDYFSFFDHAEFSADGGTTYLVKFLRAFAGARMTARMVAVFDNDTAGIQAYEQALGLNLPANFIVTRLPDVEIARHYPTIGPSGPAELDINGSAAGIEIYLGKDALSRKGVLRPVRWTGYVAAKAKYQGEVEGKSEVLHAFLNSIAGTASKETARAQFPELATVWQGILSFVEQNAADQCLHSHFFVISRSQD